ncbi:hypothetical protein [Aeromonas dhakensis]|uniref:hypothetical protein n=1 Tax=Aeromonas dhakensis TaxID=196024 RepID=UPI000A89D951|nr:hypothetical protein [Aeromonas dhakensis]
MSLSEYVKRAFGETAEKKLYNIHRGGSNNRKGNTFETYFAVAKICDIVANRINRDYYFISSQDLSFVDDICIIDKLREHKENYQAKNSNGSAGLWSSEIEDRFKMQREIDLNHYNMYSSKQILLVSCKEIMRKNKDLIPVSYTSFFDTNFFPYEPKSTRLIYNNKKLKHDLSKLCGTDNMSVLDTAFRCIISAWICDDSPRYVRDIIGCAKADARPNVFGSLVKASPEIPKWLHDLVQAFEKMNVNVVCGALVVDYNGLKINLGEAPKLPILCEIEKLDAKQVLSLLMTVSVQALGD